MNKTDYDKMSKEEQAKYLDDRGFGREKNMSKELLVVYPGPETEGITGFSLMIAETGEVLASTTCVALRAKEMLHDRATPKQVAFREKLKLRFKDGYEIKTLDEADIDPKTMTERHTEWQLAQ